MLDNLERFFEIFFGELTTAGKLADSFSQYVYADFHRNLLCADASLAKEKTCCNKC
jgi:hypothetical protein